MKTNTLCSLCTIVLCLFISINGYSRTNSNKSDLVPQANPFVFLENKGQITDQFRKQREDIDFKLSDEGLQVFIGSGQIQYQWTKIVQTEETKTKVKLCVLTVKLEGADKVAQAIKEQAHSYHENYYLPQCPDGAVAHSYEKVTYKNIYPDIDWVLYAKNGKLKYDFVVHPGGDVNNIKLVISGDSAVKIEKGKFKAITSMGVVEEDAPYAYEVQTLPDGTELKKEVPAKFILNDDVLSFETGKHNGTMVIDPDVRWVSYFGGDYNDYGYSVAAQWGTGSSLPSDHKIFFVGKTLSWNNIAYGPVHKQNLSYDEIYNGTFDGFVAAYSPGGIKQWATYYGGDSTDELVSGACDKNGNIYVAGNTRSISGIATTGAHRTTTTGEPQYLASYYKDCFIVKLDKDGTRQWGTYYGGESWEWMKAIAVDYSDNVFVLGETLSLTGISTPNSHQPNLRNAREVFLVKFNSSGVRQWGTYYGDSENEYGSALTCDNTGNVYMAGWTTDDTCGRFMNPAKDTAIATTGAHQFWPANRNQPQPCDTTPLPTPPPPVIDGFIVKFNSAGKRQWGTYYGGKDDDYINALAFDTTRFVAPDGKVANGLLYAGGSTKSNTGIASAEGWQTAIGGENDGFVAAFISNTGARYWSTYIGGSNADEVSGMDVDTKGSLYVVGRTTGTGMATPDAYKPANQGLTDGFLAVYNQAALQSFTYLGGNRSDYLTGVSLNDADFAFVTGSTLSSGIADGWTNTVSKNGGIFDEDVLMARFDADRPMEFSWGLSPALGQQCPGTENSDIMIIEFNLMNPPPFKNGNTFTVQISDVSGSFVNAKNIGTNISTSLAKWTIPVNTPPGIGYRLRVISDKPRMISEELGFRVMKIPFPQITSDSIACSGDTIYLTATDTITGTIKYKWVDTSASFLSGSKDTLIVNATPAHSGRYIISASAAPNSGGCTAYDTIDITVNARPSLDTITNNSPLCAGGTLKLWSNADTTGGSIVTWEGPGGFSQNGKSIEIPSVQTNKTGTYTVKVTRDGCSSEGSTNVQVDPQPVISNISSNTPVCLLDTIELSADVTPANAEITWTGPGGFVSDSANTLIFNSVDSNKGVYKLTAVLGNCHDEDSVDVNVAELFTLTAGSNSPVTEGEELKLTASTVANAVYSWTGPNGFTSSDQNPVIPDVTKLHEGIYKVLAATADCDAGAIVTVIIKQAEGAEAGESMYPNPNNGHFTLKIRMNEDRTVPCSVVNRAGQVIYEFKLTSKNKLIEETVNLPDYLSQGVYTLRMSVGKDIKTISFVIKK